MEESEHWPSQVSGIRFAITPQEVPHIHTRYRTIKTRLPVPESLPLLKTLHDCEPRSMWADGPPLVWDRAEGFQVFDPYGNKWLDFGAAAFSAGAGHANPDVIEALKRTLDKPLISSYLYPTGERAELVRTLTGLRPGLDCALLFNAGTEAVETALKVARLRGEAIHPEKLSIVAFTGAFHGKTLGSLEVSDVAAGAHPWVRHPSSRVHRIPYPFPGRCAWEPGEGHVCSESCFRRSIDDLVTRENLNPSQVAAIIFEPYQGWSSNLAPKGFVQAMRAWADEHRAVLIADEIQSGFGRSGQLFGCDHSDIVPDIMCLSKGVSNGVPMSVVLGRRDVLDVDMHVNSTNAGHPLLASATLATVNFILRERLWERAAELGELVAPRLEAIRRKHPSWASHVFGRGLTWSILPRDPVSGSLSVELPPRVVEKCFQKGLYVTSTPGPCVKIAPPLVIEREALLEGLDVLEDAFDEAVQSMAKAA
jgi:4-aminobutyrate aminotransferase-like enzyme